MPKRPDNKEIVYGLAAGLAVLEKRPDDVLKIAHTA